MSFLDSSYKITVDQAYDVAIDFIKNYWIEWGRDSPEIEILLSGMHRDGKGFSSDPGMSDQWLKSAEKIINKNPNDI